MDSTWSKFREEYLGYLSGEVPEGGDHLRVHNQYLDRVSSGKELTSALLKKILLLRDVKYIQDLLRRFHIDEANARQCCLHLFIITENYKECFAFMYKWKMMYQHPDIIKSKEVNHKVFDTIGELPVLLNYIIRLKYTKQMALDIFNYLLSRSIESTVYFLRYIAENFKITPNNKIFDYLFTKVINNRSAYEATLVFILYLERDLVPDDSIYDLLMTCLSHELLCNKDIDEIIQKHNDVLYPTVGTVDLMDYNYY